MSMGCSVLVYDRAEKAFNRKVRKEMPRGREENLKTQSAETGCGERRGKMGFRLTGMTVNRVID